MVDYSKKAKFHKVKCPQCKASLLIKPTVKVCPICEGTLRFLEALKEKQYIVRDWNPAECGLRDVMHSFAGANDPYPVSTIEIPPQSVPRFIFPE